MLRSGGFYGKGGKGNYGWLLRSRYLDMNPILLLPVLLLMSWRQLVEPEQVNDEGEMLLFYVMRCGSDYKKF